MGEFKGVVKTDCNVSAGNRLRLRVSRGRFETIALRVRSVLSVRTRTDEPPRFFSDHYLPGIRGGDEPSMIGKSSGMSNNHILSGGTVKLISENENTITQ